MKAYPSHPRMAHQNDVQPPDRLTKTRLASMLLLDLLLGSPDQPHEKVGLSNSKTYRCIEQDL